MGVLERCAPCMIHAWGRLQKSNRELGKQSPVLSAFVHQDSRLAAPARAAMVLLGRGAGGGDRGGFLRFDRSSQAQHTTSYEVLIGISSLGMRFVHLD